MPSAKVSSIERAMALVNEAELALDGFDWRVEIASDRHVGNPQGISIKFFVHGMKAHPGRVTNKDQRAAIVWLMRNFGPGKKVQMHDYTGDGMIWLEGDGYTFTHYQERGVVYDTMRALGGA